MASLCRRPAKSTSATFGAAGLGSHRSPSGSAAMQSSTGLHNPRLNLQATYSYIGTRPADPQNNFDLKAYGKLDLRAGIQGRNLELYAWADNLLDEGYDLFAYQYTPSVRVGVPGRGRTLGVGFNWFF
ncbi:MAG: TonB-dependent receptor [Rhodocyclaceae bacterium]|nr:TonB-dependent receptor [Rhodocyclaceae bacterium]